MKNLELEIPSPCSENYKNFKPTKNGGFCNTCSKEVIDFTKMNDDAIKNYFTSRNSRNTCGLFKKEQLSSYNTGKSINRRVGFFSGIGLSILSFFSLLTGQAQNFKLQNESDDKVLNTNDIKSLANIIVKGKVITEDKLPLPGANVILEGTKYGVQTDFDGNFVFPKKLKKGDILVFSYVGLKPRKVVVNSAESVSNIELEVDMSLEDICVIAGKVAVKKIYKSKKRK